MGSDVIADKLVPLAQLVSSTVLAAVVACIAWLQYRINRERLEAERRDRDWQQQYAMFDRRWEVYTGVRKYLDEMTGDLEPERMLRAVHELMQLRWAADVLFGPEVNAYLGELLKHGIALRRWREERLSPPSDGGIASDQVVAGETAELDWFSQQYNTIVNVFANELRLSDSRR